MAHGGGLAGRDLPDAHASLAALLGECRIDAERVAIGDVRIDHASRSAAGSAGGAHRVWVRRRALTGND